MPKKILSDFDGVLTDLKQEALRVSEIFESKLYQESGQPAEVVKSWLEEGKVAMRGFPYRYGWKIKGRIAAFCNEDAFIRVNSLGVFLDEKANHDPVLAQVKLRLTGHGQEGLSGFYDLAQASFQQMTRETSRGEHNPIEQTTVHAIEAILRRGHGVVIVSNSKTDRIVHLLQKAGLPALAHQDGHQENSSAPLRVRGGAGKFLLGDRPDSFNVGEYKVEVDRPAYRKILEEEKPDIVIGDVFSLDLALPLQLAERKVPGFESLKIWLRKRDYTPEWSEHYVTESCQEASGGVLEEFDELVVLGTA